MPDGNRSRRLDNQGELIANKVFIRINLMVHEPTNTICKVSFNCFPFHGIYYRVDSL